MTAPLHFHFVTLFPEVINLWLTTSIMGRAREKGLFDFTLYNLRNFANDPRRSVDDVAYGGGGGMVLKIQPLVAAVESIIAKVEHKPVVIYLSPGGTRLTCQLLNEMDCCHPQVANLVLVCGHYEGIDQRFIDHWVDREISVGDFVVTGGELPALVFADALIRRRKGVLGTRPDAHKHESFHLHDNHASQLLEYPHYTRPAEFRGFKVPPILVSGNHQSIAKWRYEQSLGRTKNRRPDLMP